MPYYPTSQYLTVEEVRTKLITGSEYGPLKIPYYDVKIDDLKLEIISLKEEISNLKVLFDQASADPLFFIKARLNNILLK
jgi:hypothetical protein